jgi:hypothetical protein
MVVFLDGQKVSLGSAANRCAARGHGFSGDLVSPLGLSDLGATQVGEDVLLEAQVHEP